MEPTAPEPVDPNEHTREFEELMERVRTLSDGASRELVQRYGPHILNVVRRRLHQKLRPKFDSQDFVQSVWATFFALPLDNYDFSDPDMLSHFLTVLAQNEVVDAVRQRLEGLKYNVDREEVSLNDSELPPAVAGLPAREPTPQELAIAKEVLERLVTRGSQVQNDIMQAAAGTAKTIRQMAEEIGVSERTIRRVLRHAAPRSDTP